MLSIRLNGEGYTPAANVITISDLLAAHGIQKRKGVAVAVNGEVVSAADWHRHALATGDDVEIVKPIGGG